MEPRREALAEGFEAALERIGEPFLATSPLQKAAADLARLQDLADVLRLIAAARLPRELGQGLDPSVRAKYDELWDAAQHPEDDY